MILFGMLFTLIIWIFSALSLLLAVIFYITFLWHHIRDGSLSRYCRRKIDTRLHRIVMVKVNKALQKDTATKSKHDGKGLRAATPQNDVKRQPTLPVLSNIEPQATNISRQDTQTNRTAVNALAVDNETPSLPATMLREPTVPNVFSNTSRPLPPSRSTTQSSYQSNRSFKDDTPLISSAAPLGQGRTNTRNPSSRIQADRLPFTSQGPASIHNGAVHIDQNHRPPGGNFGPNGRGRPVDPSSRRTPELYPPRSRPFPSGRYDQQAEENVPRLPEVARNPSQEYEMQYRPPTAERNGQPSRNGQYAAFRPNNEMSGLSTQPQPFQGPPTRNVTQPHRKPPVMYPNMNAPPQRSGTAPIPAKTYNSDFDYGHIAPRQQPNPGHIPYRPATAGPQSYGQRRPVAPRYDDNFQ